MEQVDIERMAPEAPGVEQPAAARRGRSEQSRINGARSSGPRSEEGKARSGRNARRHGLCAPVEVSMPGEDPRDLNSVHESLLNTLDPDCDLGRQLVHWMALCLQQRARAARLMTRALVDGEAAATHAERASAQRRAELMHRYATSAQNLFHKHMGLLERLRERPAPGLLLTGEHAERIPMDWTADEPAENATDSRADPPFRHEPESSTNPGFSPDPEPTPEPASRLDDQDYAAMIQAGEARQEERVLARARQEWRDAKRAPAAAPERAPSPRQRADPAPSRPPPAPPIPNVPAHADPDSPFADPDSEEEDLLRRIRRVERFLHEEEQRQRA